MQRACLHKLFLISVILLGPVVLLDSCTKDVGKSPELSTGENILNCDTVTYTYNADVATIINTNCSGCHFAGSSYGTLTDYSHLQAKALDGSLVKSLRGQQGYAVMPPTGRLNECDIQGIEKWVQAGANNN